MVTTNVADKTSVPNLQFFAKGRNPHSLVHPVYEANFVTITGNQDATINRYILGDIIKIVSNKIQKAESTDIFTSSVVIGFIEELTDINGNTYNYVGDKTLVAPNGVLVTSTFTVKAKIYTGNSIEYPIFSKELYLHNTSAGVDTRVPFNWATHGATGVLAGRVRKVNDDAINPTITFV